MDRYNILVLNFGYFLKNKINKLKSLYFSTYIEKKTSRRISSIIF